MEPKTKVYFYKINNDNEAYESFRQVGLDVLNRNEERVINTSSIFHQLTKVFIKSYKPDTCIECIFNGTTISENIMRVIRRNGDMTTDVNDEILI